MSKALVLGFTLASHQRAGCNQSSSLICPKGLDYRLLSILNIPEAISLFLSDKYSPLPHKGAPFFSDVCNIIFLSPAFIWKHFQIASHLRFPCAFRKGEGGEVLDLPISLKKRVLHLHWNTLAASTEVSAHAGSHCRTGYWKGAVGRGTYCCWEAHTHRETLSSPPI